MIAAAAMAMSSLSVGSTSNHLRGFKPKPIQPVTSGRSVAEPKVEVGSCDARPISKNAPTGQGGDITVSTAIDPICGMTVDSATAEYPSFYNGKADSLCSAGCKVSIDKDSETLIGTSTKGERGAAEPSLENRFTVP